MNKYEKLFRVAVNLSYKPYGDIGPRKFLLKRYLAVSNFLKSHVSCCIAILALLAVSGNNYRARGITGSKRSQKLLGCKLVVYDYKRKDSLLLERFIRRIKLCYLTPFLKKTHQENVKFSDEHISFFPVRTHRIRNAERLPVAGGAKFLREA